MTKPGSRYISGHNGVNNKGNKRPDMVGELGPGFKKGPLHYGYGKPAWNT
jgi:hypothetical protein